MGERSYYKHKENMFKLLCEPGIGISNDFYVTRLLGLLGFNSNSVNINNH